MGLFISKNIIEAHDGMIWAENNNGDFIGNSTGATFVSNLPIRTERRNHFGYLDNIKKTFKNTCGFDLLSDWKSKIHNVLLTK